MTREAINELKKYTLGKKNTEKVEINVLKLNRIIKALEQNLIDHSKLIELLYDNNVRCDQTIEGLADDIMSLQKEVK